MVNRTTWSTNRHIIVTDEEVYERVLGKEAFVDGVLHVRDLRHGCNYKAELFVAILCEGDRFVL